MSKVMALIEVLVIRGIIIIGVFLLAKTSIIFWQIENLGTVYTSHLLFILVPILWLVIARRDLVEYGIWFRGIKFEFITAMGVYLPVALSGIVLGFVSFTSWQGALIISIIQVGLLFYIARVMNTKPDPKSGIITVVLSVILFGFYGIISSALPTFSEALLKFIFYFFFVGLGEEILYRGYILTRLNQSFGCPFNFREIKWGWGAVISAALFGLSHVLNGWNILTGEFTPLWWWGVWTFFGAFVFTYIREKSGSIIPGAIVHGLPQALLALFIQFVV